MNALRAMKARRTDRMSCGHLVRVGERIVQQLDGRWTCRPCALALLRGRPRKEKTGMSLTLVNQRDLLHTVAVANGHRDAAERLMAMAPPKREHIRILAALLRERYPEVVAAITGESAEASPF